MPTGYTVPRVLKDDPVLDDLRWGLASCLSPDLYDARDAALLQTRIRRHLLAVHARERTAYVGWKLGCAATERWWLRKMA